MLSQKDSTAGALRRRDHGPGHAARRRARVASAIKAASPATPVVLLTGWGQRLVDEGDIPPHVDHVLNKPPKLRGAVRTALAELTADTDSKG